MASCAKVMSGGDGLKPNFSAGISTVAAMISLLRTARAWRTKLETLLASCARTGQHHSAANARAVAIRCEFARGQRDVIAARAAFIPWLRVTANFESMDHPVPTSAGP